MAKHKHRPPTDCLTIRLVVQGPGDRKPWEHDVWVKDSWTRDPDLGIHYKPGFRYSVYHRHTSCDMHRQLDTLPHARHLLKRFRQLATAHNINLKETRPVVLADAFDKAARKSYNVSIRSAIRLWVEEYSS